MCSISVQTGRKLQNTRLCLFAFRHGSSVVGRFRSGSQNDHTRKIVTLTLQAISRQSFRFGQHRKYSIPQAMTPNENTIACTTNVNLQRACHRYTVLGRTVQKPRGLHKQHGAFREREHNASSRALPLDGVVESDNRNRRERGESSPEHLLGLTHLKRVIPRVCQEEVPSAGRELDGRHLQHCIYKTVTALFQTEMCSIA